MVVFRDGDIMFGAGIKARRELLPTTSMSGMFEPIVYSSVSFQENSKGMCRKETDLKASVKRAREREI